MKRDIEKQTRYLSQAVRLEEAVNPGVIRATITLISLAILTFIIWAAFTNINEVARTPGEVVPDGYQQVVQHLEGGMVKKINISEGQFVEKNTILLHLDESALQSDLNRAQSKQNSLEMQEERLRAYIENRKPNFSEMKNKNLANDQEGFFAGMRTARDKEQEIIKKQILQKEQSIRTLQSELQTAKKNQIITKSIYEKRKTLEQKRYISTLKLLESERQLNEINGQVKGIENQVAVSQKEIEEYEVRLASLSARYLDEINEKLDQTLEEKIQNTEILQKLKERVERLDIRAPAHGIVKGLTINTVGAVIQPGQTIMEIVPLDKQLEVSIKIPPQHIGHLKIGQPVNVKFSTFDFSRYGSISGKLEKISATTFSSENGERYYQGTVILAHNYVGHDKNNLIMPGMTAMADIITGEKTILEYLLKPVSRALKTAFTER